MKYAERSAGFKGVERYGSPGPTMHKGAKTSAESAPKLMNDRQLQARDNSGGLQIPVTYSRWELGRTGEQGGVPVFNTTAAKVTSARGSGQKNEQLPMAKKQEAQTDQLSGPGGPKTGHKPPEVKRASRAP